MTGNIPALIYREVANMIEIISEKNVIEQIQGFLRTLQIYNGKDVTVPIDGIYETNTRNSVIAFQLENNLPTTGVVDAKTYELLYSKAGAADIANAQGLPLYIFPDESIVAIGEVSDAVRAIQIVLNVLSYGYDDIILLEVNGIYDQPMADNVSNFQRKNALDITGNVDKKTWNTLVKNYNKYRTLDM